MSRVHVMAFLGGGKGAMLPGSPLARAAQGSGVLNPGRRTSPHRWAGAGAGGGGWHASRGAPAPRYLSQANVASDGQRERQCNILNVLSHCDVSNPASVDVPIHRLHDPQRQRRRKPRSPSTLTLGKGGCEYGKAAGPIFLAPFQNFPREQGEEKEEELR